MEILHIDYQSPTAAQELYKSLIDTGFAVFRNHPIDYSLIETIRKDWKNFFSKDLDYKNKYLFKRGEQTGYFPYQCENAKGNAYSNLMEFFHWKHFENLPEGIGETSRELNALSFAMAQQILNWIEECLPVEVRNSYAGSLPEFIKGESAISLIRFLYYPALKGNEHPAAMRAADHEDIGLLTILPAATTEGLQVKDVNGNWHDVTTNPEEVVINAGDMLQEITQGLIKSTTHRVINPPKSANVERFSTPCFFSTRPEVRLSPRYTAAQYYRERMEENGLLEPGEEFFIDKYLAA